MKKIIAVVFLWLAAQAGLRASEAVDAFTAGLRAFQANGPEALMSAWYGSDSETKLPELRARLTALSSRLGTVLETETFEPKTLGKRVTRVYGVIYFQKRPLWIRADYYTAEGSGGFIALEFSIKPDEILPAEVGIAK
jgi:hypothetical protein